MTDRAYDGYDPYANYNQYDYNNNNTFSASSDISFKASASVEDYPASSFRAEAVYDPFKSPVKSSYNPYKNSVDEYNPYAAPVENYIPYNTTSTSDNNTNYYSSKQFSPPPSPPPPPSFPPPPIEFHDTNNNYNTDYSNPEYNNYYYNYPQHQTLSNHTTQQYYNVNNSSYGSSYASQSTYANANANPSTYTDPSYASYSAPSYGSNNAFMYQQQALINAQNAGIPVFYNSLNNTYVRPPPPLSTSTAHSAPLKATPSSPPPPRKTTVTLTVPTTKSSATEPFVAQFPDSFKEWVKRAFERCQSNPELKKQAETYLKAKVNEHIVAKTQATHNWDEEPLPPFLAPLETTTVLSNIKDANNSHEAGKNFPSASVIAKLDSIAKSRKRKKEEMLPTDHEEYENDYDYKKQSRAKRFSKSLNKSEYKKPPLRKILPSLDVGDESENWDNLTVIGTCTNVEKDYLRLTSAPDPSVVRPESILKLAMESIKKKWVADQNYINACSQLKAVRQDLTVQRIRSDFTVLVYETHARLALENGDVNEFNQCQTQLMYLYATEDLCKKHEAEFLAYRILYYIHINSVTGMNATLGQLTPEMRAHDYIQHSLKVRTAVSMDNYHTFFVLYRDVPNLGVYLMDILANSIRKTAMFSMVKAFKPSFPVDYVQNELGFDTTDDCVNFLNELNVVISKGKEGDVIDTTASSKSITRPEAKMSLL